MFLTHRIFYCCKEPTAETTDVSSLSCVITNDKSMDLSSRCVHSLSCLIIMSQITFLFCVSGQLSEYFTPYRRVITTHKRDDDDDVGLCGKRPGKFRANVSDNIPQCESKKTCHYTFVCNFAIC